MRVRLARAEDSLALAGVQGRRAGGDPGAFEPSLPITTGRRGLIETSAQPLTFVAEADDGSVLGWVTLSPHSLDIAEQGIADCAVHVEAGHRGRGVGTALMTSIVLEAQRLGYRKLISRIAVSDEMSRAVYLRAGFRDVGVFERHARLAGRLTDMLIVERLIPENQH